MKKIIIILLATIVSTAAGLYFRPDYPLIGQIDWIKVLTKGYFVGSIAGFFGQGFIDESFWYVMRFTVSGVGAGFLLCMFAGKAKGSPAKKKK